MARARVLLQVEGDRFAVRVTPGSRAERLIVEQDEDGVQRIHARVTAQPEDGKANTAVIALLAKALGVPKSALSVALGATSRNKVIRVRRAE